MLYCYNGFLLPHPQISFRKKLIVVVYDLLSYITEEIHEFFKDIYGVIALLDEDEELEPGPLTGRIWSSLNE